ncbi:hypothetical protein PLICRDRAFT_91860 [Plicaturopsis crispa FD-325 SS-3]|nr:hypothetical protein PLICRDRAFT_91860 [Plicaturopsis crispa FD-325 SS-3]
MLMAAVSRSSMLRNHVRIVPLSSIHAPVSLAAKTCRLTRPRVSTLIFLPRFFVASSNSAKTNSISTLNPQKLGPRDFLNLTGIDIARIGVRLEDTERSTSINLRDAAPDRHGFLYYHPEPNGALGGIRFRITKSSDPFTFEHGTDLVYTANGRRHHGEVWAVRSRDLARNKRHPLLRRLLLQDGLVAPGIFDTQKPYFRETHPSPISTLDPRKLSASDFQDISGYNSVTFPMTLSRSKEAGTLHIVIYRDSLPPPPPGTHGFFYYDAGDDATGTMAGVRFRVTDSSDPSSFPHGKDLLNIKSPFESWSIPLPTIAHFPRHASIREILENDGLGQDWKAVPKPSARLVIVKALGQPFRIKFAQDPVMVVAAPHATATCTPEIISPFRHLPPGVAHMPIAGSALCCFERPILPPKAPDRLVIRVLKFIDPPRYTHLYYVGKIPLPKEGDLLRAPEERPRAFYLRQNTKTGRALQLLLD